MVTNGRLSEFFHGKIFFLRSEKWRLGSRWYGVTDVRLKPDVLCMPINTENAASIATRASLIERLRDVEDQTAWQRFFNTYQRLIHGIARQAGLIDAEAQDVVQETVISVAKHLPGFRYDPNVCSFRTWMLRLTRWRIIGQFPKRLPSAAPIHCPFDDDATAGALIERASGLKPSDLDMAWQREWEKAVLEAALERLRPRLTPEQYQMFDLYCLRQMPVAEVARFLGTTVMRVYMTKFRITKLLKREVESIEAEGW
jgi:RNA polymerase sigma-70 factor (ECF subfamily)